MEAGLGDDAEAQRLHNAAYAFISSLIQHLPYMISASHLEKLLAISNISAESGLDIEADDSRVQCLQLVARHIDAKTLFVALEKNWEEAAVAGTFVRLPPDS
jgi:U3 small nucleolar RNA-associated protein 10